MIEPKNKFNDAVVKKMPLKHEWITHLEHHLNNAAGFNEDYTKFERVVFIAWPGNPKNPADYMEASKTSQEIGPMVAELIRDLKEKAPEIQVNLIAHSQGNGVLIKALDHLGRYYPYAKVDNTFFWQAAIPATALSNDRKYQSSEWYCPHAQKASKKITVLFSQNDNVLGPMLPIGHQPQGVNEEEVFKRKPEEELLAGTFLTHLGLKSLYIAANVIGLPASLILNDQTIDSAWEVWREIHPEHAEKFNPCLKEQFEAYHKDKSIHAFFRNIATTIQKNKKDINILLKSWQKSQWKKSGVVLLLENIDTLEAFLFEKYEMSLDDYLNPNHYLFKTMIRGLALHKLEPYLPWFFKILTFVYVVEFKSKIPVTDAMGWYGPYMQDDDIADLFKQGKLNPVNTTKWIYSHSDMKVPSEDIKKHIYEDEIIDKEGLTFGHHIGKGGKK